MLQVPVVEYCVAENATAIVIRHLQPLSQPDKQKIADFAFANGLWVYVQAKGPETVRLVLRGTEPETKEEKQRAEAWGHLWISLSITVPTVPVPASDVAVTEPNSRQLWYMFHPSDFLQVNKTINAQLVQRIVDTLNHEGCESVVLDLYCGVGNHSLALAAAFPTARVVGVEYDVEMVAQAQRSAKYNGLGNATFRAANLSLKQSDGQYVSAQKVRDYEKLFLSLIDREGTADANVSRHEWNDKRKRVRETRQPISIVMNPPRSGAKDLVESDVLSLLNVRRLIYVRLAQRRPNVVV